jgi:hypothetical protein
VAIQEIWEMNPSKLDLKSDSEIATNVQMGSPVPFQDMTHNCSGSLPLKKGNSRKDSASLFGVVHVRLLEWMKLVEFVGFPDFERVIRPSERRETLYKRILLTVNQKRPLTE